MTCWRNASADEPPALLTASGEWQATVRQVREAFQFGAGGRAAVTSPELSLNEAVRCIDALRESGGGDASGRHCSESISYVGGKTAAMPCPRTSGKKAVQFLKQKFPRVPRLIGMDPGNPLLGVRQLQRFGDAIFAGGHAKPGEAAPKA